MSFPNDVLGNTLAVGDRVGVAFSYSQASVGHIRLGIIEELNDEYDIRVRWAQDGALSPKIKYGSSTRWIKL